LGLPSVRRLPFHTLWRQLCRSRPAA
jgi:hypothetical protein